MIEVDCPSDISVLEGFDTGVQWRDIGSVAQLSLFGGIFVRILYMGLSVKKQVKSIAGQLKVLYV